MFAVLLILMAAFAMAVLFDRKLHETLAPAVFFTTLVVYVFALVLPLDVAVWICAGTLVLFVIVRTANRIRKRRFRSMSRLLAILTRRHRRSLCCELRSDAALAVTIEDRDISSSSNDALQVFCCKRITALPLLSIFFVVCLTFCVMFSNRMVFYYDDLSYWGLYTKNIFCIDKLPHLFENCSVDYKDYTPIIQIFQYIAMFGRRTFSEPAMFRANVCLIYILLLPLLFGLEDKEQTIRQKVITGVMYVIFPHILTSQFYYRLGVDLFLALSFGYALFYIFEINISLKKAPEEKQELFGNEAFRLTVLALCLAFLALVKSSGIVLCILALIMFFVRQILTDKKPAAVVKTAGLAVFSFSSYLSWQLFLRYSWNNGYLSNRVKDGIMGGGLKLPEYTGEVIVNYIRHFFTYPLTRNTIGITAFLITVFVVAVYVLCSKTKDRNVLFISSMAGLLVFAAAHLSMYLFVFDEWEAHGLLEFDRYITQYLGGVFFVSCCMLLGEVRDGNGDGDGHEKKIKMLMYTAVMVFIALLPYKDMKYLLPPGYASMTEDYKQMSENAQIEWDASGIMELGISHDGTGRITVVADVWDETTQFIEYNAVPQPIDSFVNVPAIDPGDINSFIENHLEAYVYVAKNAKEAYKGDWNETAELTEDGQSLVSGGLYRVERSNDDKTLVLIR